MDTEFSGLVVKWQPLKKVIPIMTNSINIFNHSPVIGARELLRKFKNKWKYLKSIPRRPRCQYCRLSKCKDAGNVLNIKISKFGHHLNPFKNPEILEFVFEHEKA